MPTLAEVFNTFDAGTSFEVPESWTQGRTAFGGLTASLAVEAARRAHGPDLPPLRSAQFAFTAPAVDSVEVATRMLRQGRSTTSIMVECTSRSEVAALSTLVFARPRPSIVDHSFTARPDVPRPEDCPPFADASSLRPAFVENFDIRRAGGSTPLSRVERPEFVAWARHLDATDVDPRVAVVALADCLAPAVTTSFVEWAPISTMTWTVHFCSDLTADPSGWFLIRSSSDHAANGYSYQTMAVYDANEVLVLTATQTVALYA